MTQSFCGTKSNVFSISTNTHTFFLLLIFLLHPLHNNTASTILFPGINPNCILFNLISVCTRLPSVLSTIFIVCSSCFTLFNPRLTTSFPLKNMDNHASFPRIRHSTVLPALTQFRHHFNPNFATCNYHFDTYFAFPYSSFCVVPQYKKLFEFCLLSCYSIITSSFHHHMSP